MENIAFKNDSISSVIDILDDELININEKINDVVSNRNRKTYDKIRMKLVDIIKNLEWINNTIKNMNE